MSEDAFELRTAEPGLLTAGQLALAWGCSDQTIFNYTAGKVGRRVVVPMPHVVEPSDGITRYDKAACEVWRASNVVGVGAGGKREGAGRKRRNGQMVKSSNGQMKSDEARGGGGSTLPAASVASGSAPGGAGAGGGGGGGDSDLFTQTGRLARAFESLNFEEVLRMASAGGDGGGVGPAAVRNLRESMEAMAAFTEVMAQRRKWLAREDVKDVWTRAYFELRQGLEAMAVGLADRLITAGLCAAGSRGEVMKEIEGALMRVFKGAVESGKRMLREVEEGQ